MNRLNDITNHLENVVAEHSKRNYVTVVDNAVAQQMIANAYAYFKSHNLHLGCPINVTATCLGVSVSSVVRYKNNPQTPKKIKRKRVKSATTDLHTNIKQEVRLVLYDMVQKRKYINLNTLGAELAAKCIYDYRRTSLALLLKNLGFTYRKDDHRRALMEKPHVVDARSIFLTKYMKNFHSQQKKPCIYLDETWVFSNGSIRKSWQDEDVRSVKKVSGEGDRFIVVHAGGQDGFVEGASLIFKSKTKTGDYHSEMNAETFEKWLQEKLLPALKASSIIILDNASYNSRLEEKRPTTAWRKNDLQTWLMKNNVPFSVQDKKHHLLILCKTHYKGPLHVVDKIIKAAGHEVIRLPPYHCIFNPIEMVWSEAKRLYDQEVLRIKNPVEAWSKAIGSVTSEQWSKYVRHTENIIFKYYEKEKIVTIKDLIINVNVDTDESDSDFVFETENY